MVMAVFLGGEAHFYTPFVAAARINNGHVLCGLVNLFGR